MKQLASKTFRLSSATFNGLLMVDNVNNPHLAFWRVSNSAQVS